MNIAKLAGIGAGATLTAGMFVNRLQSYYTCGDVDMNDPGVQNELNRAFLMSESPNLDRFVKQKHVDLNKVYLCSDPDSY